jgi:hypothetical protein
MRFSRSVSLISLAIFCALGLMVVSSWATRHAIFSGQRFSAGVRKAILTFAEFPSQIKSLLGLWDVCIKPKGVSNIYSNYLEISPGSNVLAGFLLTSFISENGANAVLLINLSNRSERKIDLPVSVVDPKKISDILIGSEPKRQTSFSSRHRVWHPYLSQEGILTYIIPWNDLISVDIKTGQEKWRVHGAFHHSIEVETNGDFWVCGAVDPGSIPSQNSKNHHCNKLFEDQALVKVSQSGKILQLISVADLILKSGLEYLLYGLSNPNVNLDPIHLNQITPILSDSGVFKKGQILVSLRNLSTILLVDPESHSIVWHCSGKWMNQHCVMHGGPSTFTLLDNHSFVNGEHWLNSDWKTRAITHNIETGESAEILVNGESPINFYIPIEGRLIDVNCGNWLIEDCLQGTIMIFSNQKLVFKWSNLYQDGTVGITSWSRYIKPDSVPEFLRN